MPIPGKQQKHFCTKGDAAGQPYKFRKFDANDNIRRMATDLQDAELLAKISGGDLTEIEAKYHLHLLLKKKNNTRQNQGCSDGGEQNINEARAFVELITHVEKFLRKWDFLLQALFTASNV